ncbi:hypothetical protein N8I77_011594 [Diaporthe amygdali]|uniref:Uncharacterized protein n=1 Tax=Phomopsis amygdali TaxID=1214568 RepID=A0AAD9S8M5_PHOAM|nr:hypothetical protein N8I77_011594 [Diaporthe amygdali]KAK2599874.1 hypothetical protein N8I77_011594 [Diaporthe amygdali]
MDVPTVSARLPGMNIVAMAWAFGIMADVPSVYVLANPPEPPSVDDGPEEILWKIARGWGLTFGPVFAVVLVVLLRAILPSEKRVAFVTLVFTMSLVAMLLLKLFIRDDTWSVLDMLALCVSFCGVAAYIITTEPMGRNVAGEGLDLEGGRPQYPQANLAINPPSQPPRVPQPEGEADDDSAVAQSSIRTDGPFVIGDDSTLGDG